MDVTLKVLAGMNVGQELPVAASRFLIGRAEDCQLRPKSDLISRHHCVLLVEPEGIALRDLGSRNGTFVNDERVMGERELQAGDRIKVGPLEFEVHLAEKVISPSKKRPKVTSIKDALTRTVEGVGATAAGNAESDVAGWLEDEQEAGGPTRELRHDELPPPEAVPVIEPDAATTTELVSDTISQTQVGGEANSRAKRPAPAKGNPDSGKAAADVLKQFFRRR